VIWPACRRAFSRPGIDVWWSWPGCWLGPSTCFCSDEPSSGLNETEVRRFGEILTGVVREWGVAILLVEHDMALVRQVCDHVDVLDFGQLIFAGSPDQMLHSEVVRSAYLGSEAEEGVATTEDVVAAEKVNDLQ